MKLRLWSASLLVLVTSYGVLAQSIPSQVTIWVFRPESDNSNLTLTLHMDGRRLASLGRGGFFGVRAPAGLHAFTWAAGSSAPQVVVPIGEEPQTYLEVTLRSDEPFLFITPLSPESAVLAMSGSRPVDQASVFDSSVIVPTQGLQKPSVPVAARPPVVSEPPQAPPARTVPAPPAGGLRFTGRNGQSGSSRRILVHASRSADRHHRRRGD